MPFSRGRVVPFRSGACFLSSWESAAPLRLHFNEMGAGAGLFSFARAMVLWCRGLTPGAGLSLSLFLSHLLACLLARGIHPLVQGLTPRSASVR